MYPHSPRLLNLNFISCQSLFNCSILPDDKISSTDSLWRTDSSKNSLLDYFSNDHRLFSYKDLLPYCSCFWDIVFVKSVSSSSGHTDVTVLPLPLTDVYSLSPPATLRV